MVKTVTAETRFHEPLYSEVLGTMNDTLCPSNSEIYEKEPR